MIIETNEYSLRLLSDKCQGPSVIYISNEQFGDSGEKIKNGVALSDRVPFTFYELAVKEWDKNLTLWEAEGIFKGRKFEGHANSLLNSIETKVIPEIQKQSKEEKVYIIGYSLAGLFALWTLFESDAFAGAACCSGSVWYPGWKEYAINHNVKKDSKVYLSLGKNEKNTKNMVMKTVEDNMKQQYELLRQDRNVKKLQLVWNEGGHFDKTEERMIKAVNWLLS